MRPALLLLFAGISLSACDHGNIKPVSSYNAPKAPHVRNPDYDPYQPYGQANATWRPPAFNRDRTIVKPAEPSSQNSRPDYENTPWATGGGDNMYSGTF